MLARAFFLFFVLIAGSAHALKLQYVGETSIPAAQKFKKEVLGGLSGIVWQNDKLYALSDDKGRLGEPRFVEFSLRLDKSKITLEPQTVQYLSGFPLENEKKASLDPEGFASLPNGEFVFSSEGNANAKPREMPRVSILSATGKWKADLPVPNKFLPEKIGQQKIGVQNNLAFEGLSVLPDGKTLFLANEAALTQDLVSSSEAPGHWIRIVKYQEKEKSGFTVTAEYAYRADELNNTDEGFEVFRGVSEVLAISESKLLIMERGVRLSQKNVMAQTVALYLVNLEKATDVSALEKLSDGKFIGADKTKIIDFETDLKKERAGKKVQNFEALAWGPLLPDRRKSLLVMSDNNFSKKDATELIVFAVEGE